MEVTINPAVELAIAMDDVPSNSGKEHPSCMYTFSSSAEEVLEKESPVDAPCDRQWRSQVTDDARTLHAFVFCFFFLLTHDFGIRAHSTSIKRQTCEQESVGNGIIANSYTTKVRCSNCFPDADARAQAQVGPGLATPLLSAVASYILTHFLEYLSFDLHA